MRKRKVYVAAYSDETAVAVTVAARSVREGIDVATDIINIAAERGETDGEKSFEIAVLRVLQHAFKLWQTNVCTSSACKKRGILFSKSVAHAVYNH